MQGFEIFLARAGFPQSLINVSQQVIFLFILAIAVSVAYWITRRFLVVVVERITRRSSFGWDDVLTHNHFFRRLAILVPVFLVYAVADIAFTGFETMAEILRRGALVFFVVAGVSIFNTVLRSLQDLHDASDIAGKWPIRSYLDVIRIFLYILAAIFIASVLADKSPWGVISVFGGLTAVLLLVFKDSILGFVANMQLTANDMVRVGDWIEMPKYGADGDVVDISLHTVKVQNWDNTITTIPTYHMVNGAFKNWRGMAESGGRRIKRSLYIDIGSIHFCTDKMLEGLKKYSLLEQYLQEKEADIKEFNQRHHSEPDRVGGRRQTNIGVFRAYIKAYLRSNPNINQDLTFLVRHLAPTAQGIPIEIYVFSAEKAWVDYEEIQADIFDHLLAIAPELGLRIFQNPSGYDFHDKFSSAKAR